MKSSDWTARSAMTCENKIENTLRVEGTCETNLLVSPGVSHDPHCLHRQEHGERLTNLVVETGVANFIDVDLVSLLEDFDLFASDRTQNADGKAGAGKWVALDEVVRDGQQTTERSNLILRL